MDYWVLKQLNHLMASSIFLSKQANLFNNIGVLELIMASLLVGWWFSKESQASRSFNIRHRTLLVFLAFLPTYGLIRVLQSIFHRPRPLINVPLQVPSLFQHEWNEVRTNSLSHLGSFPSDHAALFFLISTVAFTIDKRLGIISFLLSLYYGVLRVAIGYHWPSDILGGAILGCLVALTILSIEPLLKKVLDYLVLQVESHSAIAYTVSFLFLSDFGENFKYLKLIASGLGHRLFH